MNHYDTPCTGELNVPTYGITNYSSDPPSIEMPRDHKLWTKVFRLSLDAARARLRQPLSQEEKDMVHSRIASLQFHKRHASTR